ncbi:aminotransferase class III-fold pyridoxal phosphate-dependent enzyme [Bacillus sp. AFS088145]|uniref:aminotransferase class III-fold pyridoxal phosphate-dependent enzyme n=1 Tax=Bacillus sp. AFS088145 TaxID=2033514 RepID=UPI001C54F605|nr:aminotransferase class III-fold pyridoxal phosphate-dependent enzyme [Bacillus sp. AFS088145]
MEWMDQLNQISRDVIQEDERVFVRQSMSTPCLNGIVDANGNKYLEFHGNSSHQVGYNNPYVVDAIKRQVDELPFIPRRFTSEIVIKAANALVNKTTSKDYKVLFTPSGSAAVGLALKIVRKATGRHKVISMWESFHGAGLDAISVGGEYVFKKDMGTYAWYFKSNSF